MNRFILSLIALVALVTGTRADEMTSTPLTLEAYIAGTVTIQNPKGLTIEYSTDGGTTWTASNAAPITIPLAKGERVSLRGDNACYGSNSGNTSSTCISSSSMFYAYGNVMSLIDKDNFATLTTLTETAALAYLFYGSNGNLRNHPTKDLVLPATTLSSYCYYSMFNTCYNLERAPVLPATTLASNCYSNMFYNCWSLNYIKCLASNYDTNNFNNWVYGNSMSGSFVTAEGAYWTTGNSGAPKYFTIYYGEEPYFPYRTPLTFEAVAAGTVTVNYDDQAGFDPIQYRLNDGDWTDVAWNTPISLAANDIISFRGSNGTCFDGDKWAGFGFSCSNDCYVYGNVMSLIDEEYYPTNTTLMKDYCFAQLFAGDFNGNTTIKNHPTKDIILPATTLTNGCYQMMFNGCQGLTRAPQLPATTLADYCYNDMFSGCTSLAEVPDLPATTVAEGSCCMMFSSCTSLVTAPALPAVTLANMCYSDMFMGCTALTTAPVLYADVLAEGCYSNMFNGCSSLNSITCLATDISADNCLTYWTDGVDATGTFTKNSEATWPTGTSGIPTGWTMSEMTKTPYVIYCSGNSTLYFTGSYGTYAVGDSFTPEGSSSSYTITNVWSGSQILNSPTVSYSPAWDTNYTLRRNFRYVEFEPSFASFRPKSGYRWFSGMTSLRSIGGLQYLNTSEMTTMAGMFYNCTSLYSFDVSGFDTRNVTDMSDMFNGCSNASLTTITFGPGWDTSNVTDMSEMFDGCSRLTTLDLSGFNTGKVTNMRYMFSLCQRLTQINVSGWDVSNVTNMFGMFSYCYYFNEDVSGWNTSQVTNMDYLFQLCNNSLTSLDLSGWDVGNVESMECMFSGCTKLESIGDVSGWNTGKVKSMTLMFNSCAKLASINLGSWNTSNVLNMRSMFNGCTSLTSLEVSAWNTSKVAYMASMFEGCTGLTSLDLSHWNTSGVCEMGSMFKGCTALHTLNISGLSTKNATNMSSMFNGCSALTALDVSSFTSVTTENMNSMFAGCSGIASLDLSGFYTSNVTDMGALFSGCSQLQSVTVSNLWTTANVTTDANMFAGCEAIVGQDGTTFDANTIDKTNAHYAAGGYLRKGTDVALGPQPYVIYDADATTLYLLHSDETLTAASTFTPNGATEPATISKIWYGDAVLEQTNYTTYYEEYNTPWSEYVSSNAYNTLTKVVIEPSFSTVKPTSTASWFNNFQSITEIVGLPYLDTSETTDMSQMFYLCENLPSLDVTNFNTSKVTDMNSMFYSCYNLTNIDVSGFDTRNVTNMYQMFAGCGGLRTIDVSRWNTSKVENMVALFSQSGIESIDVSNFDTRNVYSVNSMFYGCQNLTTLDLSTFDTSSLTECGQIVTDCAALRRIDLSTWNTANVTGMFHMFAWCPALKAVFVGNGWNTDAVEDSREMFYNSAAIIGEDGTTYDASAIDKTNAHYNAGGYLRQKHTSWTLTIPSSGVGTFSADWSVAIPEGLTAYTCTTYDSEAGTIATSAVSGGIIPAETGVLLRGTAGQTYTLNATVDVGSPTGDNALVAVTVPTHIGATAGDYTNFMLSQGKFIRIDDADESVKMPANKAYLQILTTALASSTRGITLTWGDPTGIDDNANLNANANDNSAYDMQGRRVNANVKKGLYIVNGKKTVIR